jgi:hypothetical protein
LYSESNDSMAKDIFLRKDQDQNFSVNASGRKLTTQ